ncbi:MAG: hypothetical protein ACJ746_30985 [Bryobacteraceae bacterium]
MLHSVRNKWLGTAVLTIATAFIQPAIVSAQNSGVAGDNTHRFMWRGTDSRISLWKLDSGLNPLFAREYGPFFGWLPIALTTANNGTSYVLWRHTNGTISIWTVDANLNFSGSHQYGPFDGWIAESLSVDTNSNDRVRVIWKDTDGRAAIWIVNPNLTLGPSRGFGPFFGYVPSAGANVALTKSSDDVDRQATAAMATPSAVPSQMPQQ